jgi:hypothetical protein
VSWVPSMYTLTKIGTIFNWREIVSIALVQDILIAKHLALGKSFTFYMVSYLLDTNCIVNSFPSMGWQWKSSDPLIHICWLLLFLSTSWTDLGSDMNRFPTNPSKTIGPFGKPKGNTPHRMYCTISLEIVLWATAMLRCLQYRKEWGFGIGFDLLQALN